MLTAEKTEFNFSYFVKFKESVCKVSVIGKGCVERLVILNEL